MDDSKAMPFAILTANAFSCPTTDGIDDVGRAFNDIEAITQVVPEGMHHVFFRHIKQGSLIRF